MSLLESASPITGIPLLDKITHDANTLAAMSQILCLLEPAQLAPKTIANWLKSLDEKELNTLFARSVERTSHFKWFIGCTSNNYIVWLHEYKAGMPSAVAGSYAASIHNHRYAFVSRVLSGSLYASEFKLDPEKVYPQFVRTRRIGAGSVYALNSNDVHRIDRTDPGTSTLIVQAPAERSFSRVFDPQSGSYQDIYDLPSRLSNLVSLLSEESA